MANNSFEPYARLGVPVSACLPVGSLRARQNRTRAIPGKLGAARGDLAFFALGLSPNARRWKTVDNSAVGLQPAKGAGVTLGAYRYYPPTYGFVLDITHF